MSEPGWYPDPQDNTQKRFWNGAEWTEQIRTKDGDARPVLLPSTSIRRSNTVLWSVLVLVLCLLVGSGWWLSTNVNQSSSAPHPDSPGGQPPSTTTGATSPTESGSSPAADPAPSAVHTTQASLGDGRPRTPEQIAADPTSTENPESLKIGDPIPVIPNPETATGGEAKSEIRDGRLTSQAEPGLSIPEIKGFSTTGQEGATEKYIYQGNTLAKQYDAFKAGAQTPGSTVTLGTLKADEGFTEVLHSAVLVASYLAEGRTTRIEDVRYMPEANAAWLSIEVDLPPDKFPGLKKNYVSVFTCLRDGVMHVALLDLLDVTKQDAESYDAIWAAFQDMRLPS